MGWAGGVTAGGGNREIEILGGRRAGVHLERSSGRRAGRIGGAACCRHAGSLTRKGNGIVIAIGGDESSLEDASLIGERNHEQVAYAQAVVGRIGLPNSAPVGGST